MEKEELVHMWMANGLVQYRRGRELEDSHKTFNELLGRSFFQDIEKDEFGDIRACKIHDLMHDLAKSVSRDECYSIDSKEAAEKVCERTKHLHFNNGFLLSRDHSTPTMSLDVAKRLRSLIFERDAEFLHYILKFEFLRILCLHGYSIRKIPLCIGSLIHLRYLNFSSSSIESLPKSIGNLLNLQILKLGGCHQLDNLPKSIGNLGNLQILDLSSCFKLRHLPKELRKMRSLKYLNNKGTGLTHMPTGIGHLRDLQTLPVFVVGENKGCLIKELQELDRIKGKLFIKGLSNVACARDAIDANLRRKQNIDSLSLSWPQIDGEDNIDEEVLEGLQPHSNLKELSIDGNKGLKFPHWVDSSLTQLVELKLLNCRNCGKLPSLGQLPSLKSLHITGLHSVKYMDNELYGSCEQRGFPALLTLDLEVMENLEEISVVEGREHFPRLHRLRIVRCPKLIKITGLLKKSCTLEKIEIMYCKNLMSEPEGWLQGLTSLKDLSIRDCNNLSSLSGGFNTSCSYALERLRIINCGALTSLPEGMHCLTALEDIEIMNCENLMSMPEGWLQGLTSLKDLGIWYCGNLSSLSGGFNTSCSYALERLRIIYCGALTSLPKGMHCLTALKLLEIEYCENLRYVPEGWLQGLTSLKDLSIRDCNNLSSLSGGFNTSCSYALERLRIINCGALTSLPEGMHCLTALKLLEIKYCENLMSAPEGWLQGLTSLKVLSIRDCNNLSSLSGGFNTSCSSALERLRIINCGALTSLPEGMHCLTALKLLEIKYCENLMSAPEGWLQGLTSLKVLSIRDCNNLSSLSGGFNTSCSSALERLRIINCGALTSLPEGMHCLTALKLLEIKYCENLMSAPEGWLQGLTSLKVLSIRDCNNLYSLSGGFNTSCSYALAKLRFKNCGALTSFPEGMHCLTALEKLQIKGCPLTSLPEGMHRLTALENLKIKGCPLTSLPEGMHHLTALVELKIANCPAPTSLPEGLEYLWIAKCENLTSLPEGMHHLTALQKITLKECPALASLEGLHHLTALEEITLDECPALASLEGLHHLTALPKITLEDCPALASLEGIHHLTALTSLKIIRCKQLSSLPDSIQDSKSLVKIEIFGCGEELVRRYERKRGADWHRLAHIPEVYIS